MNNPAPTPKPLHPLITRRWSPRAIDPTRQVSVSDVCTLLEAARWAPSCFNDQPWRYFVGHQEASPRAWQAIADLLVSGNDWAKAAPLLMLSVAVNQFRYNGAPNRHAQHDVGLATENLVLQAEALGLATHQMAGFDAERAVTSLGLPPNVTPMAVIAIGYPGDPASLPEPLRERELAPRERLPLSTLVMSDYWGQPFGACAD